MENEMNKDLLAEEEQSWAAEEEVLAPVVEDEEENIPALEEEVVLPEEEPKPAKKKNERTKRLFGFKIRIGDIFEQAYNIVNENQPESTGDQEEIIDDEEEKA